MATIQQAVDILKSRYPAGIPKQCSPSGFCAGGGEAEAMAVLKQLGLAGGSYGWAIGGTSIEAMQLLQMVDSSWQPFSWEDAQRLKGANIAPTGGIAVIGVNEAGVITGQREDVQTFGNVSQEVLTQEIENFVPVGTAAINPSLPAIELISTATKVPTSPAPTVISPTGASKAVTITAVPTTANPMNAVSKMDSTTQLKWVAAFVVVLILVEVLRR